MPRSRRGQRDFRRGLKVPVIIINQINTPVAQILPATEWATR